MAIQTWYKDASTWRQAKGLWYNDGGTWRLLKQSWYNDGGTWRHHLAGQTLTAGVVAGIVAGYSFSGPVGSLSGSGAINGAVVLEIVDNLGTAEFRITLQGTWAQTLFTGININGKGYLTASATSFVSSANTTWHWAGSGNLAGLANGTTYAYLAS